MGRRTSVEDVSCATIGLRVRGSPNGATTSVPPYLPISRASRGTFGFRVPEGVGRETCASTNPTASARTISHVISSPGFTSGALQRCIAEGQPLDALRELHRHHRAQPFPFHPENTALSEAGMADVAPPGEGRNLPFFLRPRGWGRCRGMPGQELGRDFLQKA